MRDRCDWDPPIREQADVFAILLPEIQEMRHIAQLLALQARLQIAEGHVEAAVETIGTGFTIARHTADCPFLVSGLVGVAISQIMLDQVDLLVHRPLSELVLSLTVLPDPLIDFRPSYEVERDTIFLMFPELRDVARAEHTPAEWQQLMASFMRRWVKIGRELQGMGGNNEIANVITQTAMAAIGYPKAKAGLIAAGRNPKEVEAMPPAQAILVYTAFEYERASDEQNKWFSIPYWQAQEPMKQSGKKLIAENKAERSDPVGAG